IDRRLENRACLHLSDFRVGDGDTATTEAEHWIEFGELAGTRREFRRIGAHGGGNFRDFLLAVRQELMQRRIEQPDRYPPPGHDFHTIAGGGALDPHEIW